jgi:ATP-dependent Lon protease
MVDAGTAVTGAIDLRGRIHRVGAVKDKIMRAFDGEVGQLLVPMRDYEDLEAEEWPSEAAKTYYSTAVKGVTTLVDVLHYAIKGTQPLLSL